MSMSDWNDKVESGRMYLTTDEKYAGAKSLKIEDKPNGEVIKILTSTETDLPAVMNIIAQVYNKTTTGSVGNTCFFFRYQDTTNYYMCSIKSDHNYQTTVTFRKRVAGSYSLLGESGTYGALNGAWHNWKFTLCEIAGTLYCIIYKKESGVWVKKDTFTDGSPNWSAGGAIGVGCNQQDCNNFDQISYLDEVKVYYE